MTPSGNASAVNVSCGSIDNADFAAWQKAGYDAGSVVTKWPTTSEMIDMARELLELPKTVKHA